MDNTNYFKDLFESIPDYRKIVSLFFLTKIDIKFLQECRFLESDINSLNKKFKNIIFEQTEDYLSYIKNQEESLIEKLLKN